MSHLDMRFLLLGNPLHLSLHPYSNPPIYSVHFRLHLKNVAPRNFQSDLLLRYFVYIAENLLGYSQSGFVPSHNLYLRTYPIYSYYGLT